MARTDLDESGPRWDGSQFALYVRGQRRLQSNGNLRLDKFQQKVLCVWWELGDNLTKIVAGNKSFAKTEC